MTSSEKDEINIPRSPAEDSITEETENNIDEGDSQSGDPQNNLETETNPILPIIIETLQEYMENRMKIVENLDNMQ
mgnify:CR=1 FL=1